MKHTRGQVEYLLWFSIVSVVPIRAPINIKQVGIQMPAGLIFGIWNARGFSFWHTNHEINLHSTISEDRLLSVVENGRGGLGRQHYTFISWTWT